MLKQTLFLFLFFICIIGNSQTFSYKHFSVEDGLPSSEVYDVLQDNDGYMWFATDRGVVRFDGYEFEVLTTDDGLPDNVIFQLFKDHEGKIWFVSYSGALSYFENENIIHYDYNSIIEKEAAYAVPKFFYRDSLGGIHISYKSIGYLNIDGSGNYFCKASNEYSNYLIEIEDKILFYNGYRASVNYPKIDSLIYRDIKRKSSLFQFQQVLEHPMSIRQLIKNKKTNLIYFSISNTLYTFNYENIKIVKRFDSPIQKIDIINDQIWIGFSKSGYAVFNNDLELVHSGLESYSPAGFFLDRENSIWITTLDNGIYYLPNYNHYSITSNNGLTSDQIYSINGNTNHLMICDRKGHLHSLKLGTNKIEIHKIGEKLYPVKIILDPNTDFFLLKGGLNFHKKIKNDFSIVIDNNPFLEVFRINKDTSFVFFYEKEQIALLTEQNTQFVKKNKELIIKDFDIFFRDSKNNLLIADINGLFELKKSQNTYEIVSWKTKNPLYKSRIIGFSNHIHFDFILGTRGEGILFIKNEIPFALKKEHGLLSNQLTCLFVDSSNTIWAGSSEGLSIISSTGKITNLRMEDGLISNEITDLFVHNEKVYVGTKKGITVLDKNSISKDSISIPVLYKKVYLENDQRLEIKENTLTIPYNEPLLDIQYAGLSFKSMGRIKYRYRLNPNESWNYTDNNRLLFTNLRSGNYELEIQASNGENDWSCSPAILKINVAFPWWRTWPFIILSALLILALLVLIYRLSLKRIKNREQIKRQIQSLRFEALGAQMNPHFIFNSLNSIQNFIMSNDRKESTRYLSKFAKLMRKTLDHSSQKNITLKEELEALELYLELEALRFDQLIKYNITVDPIINPETTIMPALLIQPITENAILHGLRPKPEGGTLNVSCKLIDESLRISVIDDGIGRQTNPSNTSNHQSKGSLLTMERIQLFATENNAKSNYEIIDLIRNNIPTGTHVQIDIPKISQT